MDVTTPAPVSGASPGAPAGGDWLEGYLPTPGAWDEVLDPSGQPRPHWRELAEMMAELGPEEMTRRFAVADRHLREAGVFYRVYGERGGQDRPWPLSHIPLIIDESEWATLSRGLVQRAELLELLAADIYGPARLVGEGALPAQLIAGNAEFLRPVAGAEPRGGRFLKLYAADLGRGPDGRWWVLGDRTQAPSGLGYAIENRVAVSRALPELHRRIHAPRLAGFFQSFRDGLGALSGGAAEGRMQARVGVLTPGPWNETYFEHAYLARYLGFLLLEGADLVVREGRLLVKTVAGLVPIDVLWRRVDAGFMDPLELDTRSRLGVPGLVEAVRQGQVALVNALGTGILETRALMAFLPALSRRLLGEELILPNVATWWCGASAERQTVLDDLDRFVIQPAMKRTGVATSDEAVVAGELDAAERAVLAERIARDGAGVVAQEVVRLSTLPVWTGGRLEPRPFVLRVFLAHTESGWQVMPGGFCRVSERADTRALTMQQGGRAADVCIRSARPTRPTTLLPERGAPFVRRGPGILPSRAADSLFWLGRYTERAETIARGLRAAATIATETGVENAPVYDEIGKFLQGYGVESADGVPPALLDVAERAFFSASTIRDRFAPDGWLLLRDLAEGLRPQVGEVSGGPATLAAMNMALRMLAAFSGLTQENMYRFTGWRFLEAGRRLERGLGTARLADRLGAETAPVGSLDMLLEIADSVVTHRRRYSVALAHDSVLDLVVLDPHNPRSVAFQVEGLEAQIQGLPEGLTGGPGGTRQALPPRALDRLLTRLSTDLITAEPSGVDSALLGSVVTRLMQASDLIAERWFTGAREVVQSLEGLA